MSDQEFLKEIEAVASRDQKTDNPIVPAIGNGPSGPIDREATLDLPCFLNRVSRQQRELLLDRN